MRAFYGAITLSSAHKTRFFLFHSAIPSVPPSVRPSIHPEVFAPSHFHLDGIFSFLSAKTHATEEKAQIEDAEGETLSSEQRKKTDRVSSFFEMNERKETIITECSE